MGTLKKMASDPHLNGIPTVMDGVQHNMAFGKQFRDNRPVNTIRADTLTSDVTIDANHHEGKSVSVVNLTFRYNSLYHEAPIVLDNVTVPLEPGARCLLLGSNGAGKSTLLNLMGGKHIHPSNAVVVLGQPAFHNTHPGIINITGNWTRTASYEGHSVAYTKDISVQDMINTVPLKDRDPARIEKIVDVLDIDLEWRMHIVSDGQRRRVQLLMGLMKLWKVLLLDEVTVDLDVVARSNLLSYLKEETEVRGATIVYATHIFDGLDHWATHLARIRQGRLVKCAALSEWPDYVALASAKSRSPLLKTVTAWLRAEKEEDRAAAAERKKLGLDEVKVDKVDLKLNRYIEDSPFAENRMYNMTAM